MGLLNFIAEPGRQRRRDERLAELQLYNAIIQAEQKGQIDSRLLAQDISGRKDLTRLKGRQDRKTDNNKFVNDLMFSDETGATARNFAQSRSYDRDTGGKEKEIIPLGDGAFYHLKTGKVFGFGKDPNDPVGGRTFRVIGGINENDIYGVQAGGSTGNQKPEKRRGITDRIIDKFTGRTTSSGDASVNNALERLFGLGIRKSLVSMLTGGGEDEVKEKPNRWTPIKEKMKRDAIDEEIRRRHQQADKIR